MSDPAAWRGGDRALNDATIRLTDATGTFLGTGFVVCPDGHALTCHHVVVGRSSIRAIDKTGTEWEIVRCPDGVLEQWDVAIIKLEPLSAGQAIPAAVPLSLDTPKQNIRTRVMSSNAALVSSVPFSGRIEGLVETVYTPPGGRRYGPNPLHLIRGVTVEHGWSGAPVWDDELEAVVGLIAVGILADNNIGGFAVPLASLESSPTFGRLLEDNRRSVARYGKTPNQLAIAWTAKCASAGTIDRLISRGIYIPNKTIARGSFEPILAEFLASNKAALPIVGPAGQGKSTLLADLAGRYSPVFLFRGTEVNRQERPTQMLDRLIRTALQETETRFTDFQCIRPGQDRSDPVPVFALDAVNELPFTESDVADEWLPDLIGIVRKAGMKAIFTCRPEFFRLIAHAPYANTLFDLRKADAPVGQEKGRDERKNWFVLNGFEDHELAQARQAYGVPAGLSEMITRRPLLLRLAAEAIEGNSLVTRSSVLRSYLNGVTRRVATTLGVHQLVVDKLLRNFALEAVRSEAGIVSAFNPIIQLQHDCVQRLTTENIVEEVPSGFRFVFDEVYEFVRATIVSEAMIAADINSVDVEFGKPNSTDVISLAMESLIDNGQLDALRSIGQVLVRKIEDRESQFWKVYSASRAILDLVRTIETDQIKQQAVHALGTGESEVLQQLAWGQERTLALLPWPAAREFLYNLFLEEDGYDWREKEVHDQLRRQQLIFKPAAAYGATKVVAELFDVFPDEAAKFLIDLLTDETRLSAERTRRSSSEGSIGELALCMLWIFRAKIGISTLFSAVMLPDLPGGMSLFSAFAEEAPEQMLHRLVELNDSNGPDDIDRVRSMWSVLLENSSARPEFSQAADEFYAVALKKLSGRKLNYALRDICSRDLLRELDVGKLLEQIGKDLDAASILASLRARRIDLSAAIEVAKRCNKYNLFICELVGEFEAIRSLMPLSTLVSLIQEVGLRHLISYSEGRFGFERLMYGLGFQEAAQSGLIDELERWFVERDQAIIFDFSYLAFSATSDAQKKELRLWLAVRICLRGTADLNTPVVVGGLVRTPQLFERHPDAVMNILTSLSARDFLIGLLKANDRGCNVELVITFAGILKTRFLDAKQMEEIVVLDRFLKNWDESHRSLEDLHDAVIKAILDEKYP